MIYNSILETIGNTPIVRLNRMGPDHVNIYVKVESFNPLASVKDRLAFAIMNDAERRGTLKPGQTVIEATSGNTGIALAMVCAVKGHQFVATMADSFSVERRKIKRGMGAKVILTPAAERGTGMVKKAEELAEKHGWFLARQFENEANPEYHRQTTAPEILQDFAGERLDYWVTGYGTGLGCLKQAYIADFNAKPWFFSVRPMHGRDQRFMVQPDTGGHDNGEASIQSCYELCFKGTFW